MNILLDSMVAKGAPAKGRSSAKTLGPVMKRVAAVPLPDDLYVAYNYAATKLNVSDDPTRERAIREGSKLSVRQFLKTEELREESMFSLSPGLSCWFRMTVLLVGIQGGEASARVGLMEEVPHFDPKFHLGRLLALSSIFVLILLLWTFFISPSFSVLDFPYLFSSTRFHGTLSYHRRRSPGLVVALLVSLALPVRAPMAPDTRAEVDRANLRTHLRLNADRVVRHETRDRRYRLLDDFRNWLWDELSTS